MTGYGIWILCESAEDLHMKKLHLVKLFLADLSHLKPLRPALFQPDPMKTFVQSSIEYLHGLIT